MTVICRFIIDADDFDLGHALKATTTRIDLTQFVPIDGQFIPYFWKVHDDDIEAFEQSVRNSPVVEKLTNLDGRVNATLYRIRWADRIDGFLNALRTREILVEKANTTKGESWEFQVRAQNQEALSAFQNTCDEQGIHLDIRRVAQNPEKYHEGLTGVTSKQYDALALAFEEGYFDIPRETTLEELAEMVGISRQSFARRLQRAHKSITSNLLKNDNQN